MTESTKPTPTWQLILLTTIFVTGIYSWLTNPFGVGSENTEPTAIAEKSKKQAPMLLPRNAFEATPDIVIGKWNTVAIDIDKSFILPQKNLWEDGGKNDKFYVIRYQIKPSVYVSIEIDNQSQNAFSLSVLGAKQKEDDILDLFNAMLLVGVTIYGKGDNAGVIGRACKDAEKDYKEIRVGEFNVFCSFPMGVMMAGINVPK